MTPSTIRSQLLASSMITGVAVILATSAGAAVAPAAPADNAVQEVVVTGSRIPQPNLTSVSAITTVTSQDLKLQGTSNVEDLLNNLPGVFASQSGEVSNGSNGTAEADLRNLGAIRTLVLINGKRLNPGDPGSEAADLNFIPSGLVDRIDVLTGGNSSAYGSDAVAGVVNFILKKDFEGVQVDYQYSFYNHQNNNTGSQASLKAFGLPIPGDVGADGGVHTVSIILGSSLPDHKGNVTAYATYRHVDPVLQGTRDFSDCGIATVGANNNVHSCIGSSNSAYGRFDHTALGNVANNPDGSQTFVKYKSALAYNFNPLNYLQREDNRYTAGFFAHYDISKMFEVYTDFMFLDDQTNAQIAPSGLFRFSGPNLSTGYTINCNNPLLSASQAATLCPGAVITPGAPGGSYDNLQSIGYRFAAVPRNSNFNHSDYNVDVGLRGDLGEGWSYDAYLQLGVARLNEHITGYGSINKIANALNVVYGPDGKTPVCVNDSAACVPLNIFQALSAGITPAAYNYVLASSFTTGEVTQQVANLSITGDLGHYGVKSPFAADGVGINFGAEYRRDFGQINFDSEQQAGDLSGGGGQALDSQGAINVKELFVETRVPLAHDQPFIKDLTLSAGYRFSHYNTSGDTSAYKVGFEYQPIDDILIRGSYARAVRAPNVQDLYAPNVTGLAVYQDPCGVPDTGGGPAATQAQCANTGLLASQYGVTSACPASQCDVRTGGGAVTGLKPESADTYDLGVVFQPSFLPGFSASVDYFDIKVSHVISAGIASPSTILAGCLASVTSPFCALIHRDPVTGGLDSNNGFIYQTSANAGFIATDGIDFKVNYHYRLPDWFHGTTAGSLDLAFAGTWTDHLTAQPTPGGPSYDCAGLYGAACSNQFGSPVTPNFKSETRVTWNTPWNVIASLAWRYNGPANLDYLNSNPQLNAGIIEGIPSEARLHSYNYFDLAFAWKVRTGLTLRAGCQNLFDLDPPVVDANNFGISGPPYGNGNTFPGVYDSLGRRIFVGLTADF